MAASYREHRTAAAVFTADAAGSFGGPIAHGHLIPPLTIPLFGQLRAGEGPFPHPDARRHADPTVRRASEFRIL